MPTCRGGVYMCMPTCRGGGTALIHGAGRPAGRQKKVVFRELFLIMKKKSEKSFFAPWYVFSSNVRCVKNVPYRMCALRMCYIECVLCQGTKESICMCSL